MELNHKAAVITGATSGIGAAVARDLAGAGARLVLAGRRANLLRELAEELNAAGAPGAAVVLAGEITDPKMPERLLQCARDSYGQCDIVINNAGIMTGGDIETIDVEKVCEMVRVNVEAGFRMAYTAVKHFKAVGAGQLITTTSVLGMKVRENIGAYCGTKYALEALSEALRIEVAGSDIRVSCIEPGLAVTDLHRHQAVHPAVEQGFQHPLMPEDVARGVRFILEQPAHVAVPRLLMLGTEQPF